MIVLCVEIEPGGYFKSDPWCVGSNDEEARALAAGEVPPLRQADLQRKLAEALRALQLAWPEGRA